MLCVMLRTSCASLAIRLRQTLDSDMTLHCSCDWTDVNACHWLNLLPFSCGTLWNTTCRIVDHCIMGKVPLVRQKLYVVPALCHLWLEIWF